ncbi:MAG TPA: GNAT family N-acetyltransferase [Candidatus Limnocylindria bacterium]|nr:GNAT family N-acetyltransferase [Candidatus Limnocylindria bacterium]
MTRDADKMARRVEVRDARLVDADRIAEVHVASWQVAYRGLLPDPMLARMLEQLLERQEFQRHILETLGDRQRFLVAEADGVVIGFVHLGPTRDADSPDQGEIYAIYLDPAWYRRGVGRELFFRATQHLRDFGFRTAMLWVLRENDRARRFYESCGWRTDGGEKEERRELATLHEVRYVMSLD